MGFVVNVVLLCVNTLMICEVYKNSPVWTVFCGMFVNSTSHGGVYAKSLY
jgi:hypothetical protein